MNLNCALCLTEGHDTPAVTIINGTAVCAAPAHLELRDYVSSVGGPPAFRYLTDPRFFASHPS